MKTQIAGFEVFSADFDRHGVLLPTSAQTVDELSAAVQAGKSDLLVLSHGWNNDIADADALYARILASMRSVLNARPPATPVDLAVLVVHWPSKRFADEDLIPGGAAGLDAGAHLVAQLDALLPLFQDDPDRLAVLNKLKTLVPMLDQDSVTADQFGRLLRSILPPSVNEEESVLSPEFFELEGIELLERLGRPFRERRAQAGGAAVAVSGGAAVAGGGAVGLGNLFGGIRNGAQNLLNLFTYYEMKERAGTVGRTGLVTLLNTLHAKLGAKAADVRVHYVGHSFGARLVTAAVAASTNRFLAHSLCLLQGAFSHWGVATRYDGQRDGLFRAAVTPERLAGPVIITHTENDRAVGLAYPLASRLARQVASGLGGPDDPYGGIGRNGALKTPEVDTIESTLRKLGDPYVGFKPGRVSNLEASAYIPDHHTVHGQEVAQAVLSAAGIL